MEHQLSHDTADDFPVPEWRGRVGLVQALHGFVEVLHEHGQDGVGQVVDHVLGVGQFHAQDGQHRYLHREVAAEQYGHAVGLEHGRVDAAAPQQQPLRVLEVARARGEVSRHAGIAGFDHVHFRH